MMFRMSPWILATACLGGSLVLSGCGDSKEPVVYRIPKENPTPPPSPAVNAPFLNGQMSGSGGMANQALPSNSVNRPSNLPSWRVPDSWTAQPGSSVRLASFAVAGESGSLDIAVTSFPGDVGGFLANVNRWRGQLGLPPASEAEARDSAEIVETSSGPATLVTLRNETSETLAAILMHDGASWFFKMTGPSALVQKEAQGFRQFVTSVDFSGSGGE